MKVETEVAGCSEQEEPSRSAYVKVLSAKEPGIVQELKEVRGRRRPGGRQHPNQCPVSEHHKFCKLPGRLTATGEKQTFRAAASQVQGRRPRSPLMTAILHSGSSLLRTGCGRRHGEAPAVTRGFCEGFRWPFYNSPHTAGREPGFHGMCWAPTRTP